MSPLSSALVIVVALLIVLSGFFSQRAETARVQYSCTGMAIYELRRGREDRAVAYIFAAHQAYITGQCSPDLNLEVQIASPG